jgi:acyl transferase domain-containing protein
MQDIGPLYLGLLEGRITTKAPTVPFFSTISNQVIEDASQLGPSYWVANLENPVLFYKGMTALMVDPRAKGHVHLEIGPHGALAGPLKQIYKEIKGDQEYVALQNRYGDAQREVLRAMGQLFCTGVDIDFAAMNPTGVTLTNLPHYPWHREGPYWYESRVMKAWRIQPFPHHDLLGSRVAEASDVEPVWRNQFQLDKLPWMRDHVIRADVVFSSGAYIAMAGSAVSQLSGSIDYTVRHVTIDSINSPLQIHPEDIIELITSLRPSKLTLTKDSEWYDFSIVSATAAGWVKHCHGQVRPGLALRYAAGDAISLFPRAVPTARWYKAWRRFGLDYGPSYQRLHDMSFAPGQRAMAAMVLDRPTTVSESQYPLHPITITLILQSLIAAAHNGQARTLNDIYQPTYIEELYIGIGRCKETRFLMETSTTGASLIAGSGYGIDDTGSSSFHLKGATLSMLNKSDGVDCVSDPHGAVQLEWKPDIDLLDPGTLIRPGEDQTSMVTMIESLCVLCALENASQVKGFTPTEVHLQKYYVWLQEFVRDAKAGKCAVVSSTTELCAMDSTVRQALIHQIMDQAKDTPCFTACHTIYTVYESIAGILAGKMDALEVLFRDNMLTEFYNLFNWVSCRDLMELLGHTNPNLRVIEIGAGTGSTTESVIKHLKSSSGARLYSKYFFTDISAGFFVSAKKRFTEYAGIHYQTLDITKSPAEQGFEEGSFDLVIATNVRKFASSLSSPPRCLFKLTTCLVKRFLGSTRNAQTGRLATQCAEIAAATGAITALRDDPE